jgi:hypothetical protein
MLPLNPHPKHYMFLLGVRTDRRLTSWLCNRSRKKLFLFEDMQTRTDWFARPVLHVTDVEVSLRFYVNRLGFTSPWRYDEGGRARVAQVDRQGCALILADTWPEKIGKGLMFISLNVEPPPAPQQNERSRARWGSMTSEVRPTISRGSSYMLR